MVNTIKNLMFSGAFLCAGWTGTLQASPAACSNLAGTTIFMDMLYGVAGGALVSGLYMATDDNFQHSNQKLSYGALAGSALGVGVGIAEVFTRNCETQTLQIKSSASATSTKFNLFATPATNTSSSSMGVNLSLAI